MKKLVFILFSFLLSSLVSHSQSVTKEQLNQEIETLKAEVFKAAEIFLNPQNPVATRMSAMALYPFIYDPEQITAAKKVVLNQQENAGIRSLTLSKITPYVAEDNELASSIIAWMQDPKTPKELRLGALNTIRSLSFSAFGKGPKREELTAALRTIAKDPEFAFREFALNFLLGHGDTYAQGLLIDQLDKNKTELLPTVDMLRLLSLYPKGDFLPTVYKVFQNPPNKESKIEALILLGNYPAAKKTIVSLLKDKKQGEDLRSVALSSINANYPQEFAGVVQNMVIDETESERIRVTAIVMETYRRKSNQERSRRKTADQFDKNIKKLNSNRSAAIRQASEIYLEDVMPKL